MREFKNKDDVQKKSYYSDRFFISPTIARESTANDSVFEDDYLNLNKHITIKENYIEKGHLVLWIDKNDNLNAIKYAKEVLSYDFLIELSAIDYVQKKGGFEVFYEMLSSSKRKRLRFKTFLTTDETISSVSSIFKMANWSEREMYDMFGIKITNHPYLKRILMPNDWTGHPLLKTYPLHGDEAASWYEVDKIFGKEARDIIGPEERDDAAIDRYDSTRFSRLGHEVPFGMEVSAENEKKQDKKYQEDGGVTVFGKFKLVQSFDKKIKKFLKERK